MKILLTTWGNVREWCTLGHFRKRICGPGSELGCSMNHAVRWSGFWRMISAFKRWWKISQTFTPMDNYQEDVSEVQHEDESDWDFDSGIVLHETKDKVATSYASMLFLGFHPYKKIAFFLLSSSSRVVSYHLNTSKVQELGILDKLFSVSSFPYTPCWMGLFENN